MKLYNSISLIVPPTSELLGGSRFAALAELEYFVSNYVHTVKIS